MLSSLLACTEPVEQDTDGEPDSTGDNGTSDQTAIQCESHEGCESKVCLDERICENGQNIIYVNGDSNVGGSCGAIEAQCSTIKDALSQITSEKSTIHIASGTYSESIVLDGINVFLVGENGAVVQPGTVETDTDVFAFDIDNGAQVVIDGIQLDGSENPANPNNVGVRMNNNIPDVWGDEGLITKLEVNNSRLNKWYGAINLQGYVSLKMVNSNILDSERAAIFTFIAAEIVLDRVTTENNSSESFANDQTTPLASVLLNLNAPNVYVSNSVFSEPTRSIVSLNPKEEGETVFVNNTVVYNDFDVNPFRGNPVKCSGEIEANLQNNIIVGRSLTFSNDLIVNPCPSSNSILSYNSPGENNIWGDPLFVDAANGNFHLRSGSPAIDEAMPIPDITHDIDGEMRPLGLGPDIGADEAE